MNIYEEFKPNLIPNSKVEDPINLKDIIGDNIKDYIISAKKDGCRMVLKNGEILSRALKPVTSEWVIKRYTDLANVCKKHNIILEGEFYSHDMKFNEIFMFFKSTDITTTANKAALEKLNTQGKFESLWPGRTVEWATTYHDSLKLWPFDIIYCDDPKKCYNGRILGIIKELELGGIFYDFKDILHMGPWYNVDEFPSINTFDELEDTYRVMLNYGYEGLVIANKNRSYKFNRSTVKDNQLFKMKEDKLQYDGCVIDIIESTIVKEGAEKKVNELGRSVTSKLQEDRIPSGMASGILTAYDTHRLIVSLEGFTHADLKDLWEQKEEFKGRWFRYTGMAPVKNVPRHAHASKNNMWRDDI